MLHQALCIISMLSMNSNWSLSPETLNSGQNRWNLTDDLIKQLNIFYILVQALCIISKPSMNSNWGYSLEALSSGQNRRFFPCDLEIWQMTLKNNRVPLMYYFKLCASFHSHLWIQTWVTVQKRPIWVQIDDFPCDLEIWLMTLKNNRAHLLCHIKLCVSFHHHMWIQTGVMVRKHLNWVWTSVTLTFDL